MSAFFKSWWLREAGGSEVLRLALPLVISTSSWTIMQFIDRVFLMCYSQDAMAAALPAGMLMFTLICFFLGVASYVNTFVAQYHGAGHPERIGLAVWQGILIGLFVTPLMISTIPFAPQWFAAVGHSPEVVRQEVIYYQVSAWGAGAIVLCSAMSAFFSGRGHVRIVMLVDVLGAAVNIVLDYLWIFGHGGFPEWGIAGAAWATVVALWLKVIIYLALMLRRTEREQFQTLAGCRIDPELMRRLFRFGSPSGVQFLVETAAFTAFIFLVGRIGAAELTATNLAFNVNNLAFMPIYGFGIAASILVGQRLGENQPELAARATWSSFWLSSAYTIGMALVYFCAPDVFLLGYGIGSEGDQANGLRDVTVVLLRFVGAYCLLDSVNMIFSSALKGAGDTLFILLTTCVTSGAATLLTYYGITYFGFGLMYAWTVLTGWICALGVAYLARFIQGRWRSMRVIESKYLPKVAISLREMSLPRIRPQANIRLCPWIAGEGNLAMPRATNSAVSPLPLPDAAWKQQFRRKLLAWFRRHRRDLPWRNTSDPYRIWVSEIMLQQTQVVTVIPYFERFIASFPDVLTLAAAQEREVLRHWEGLGYYRRARQLHRAAQIIADEHGGVVPRELEAVRQLPGIGRYTAGAIVSIAYDTPAPILEANTVRLLSRLLAYRGNPASTVGQALLWQMAEALLPSRGAGELNQALMELGSLLCTPRTPRCQTCPVRSLCPTFELGLQEAIPLAKPAPRIESVREAAVVVWRNGCVLLRQCNSDERWAGLWDFPRFAVKSRGEEKLQAELAANVHELVGAVVTPGQRITTLRHGVTRFRIQLDCYAAQFLSGKLNRARSADVKWIDPAELERYPLSVTARKIARLICSDDDSSIRS